MDIDKSMELFQELVSCGSNIYTWSYDADGGLLSSNCPDEALVGTAFDIFGCKDKLLRYGREESAPVVIGAAMGLIWGADFVRENGELVKYYVIGPAFFYDISRKDIERGFDAYADREISLAWKRRFLNALPQIPVAQNIVFSRCLLMLHYCLTGEKLDVSSLNFHSAAGETTLPGGGYRDRHKVWMAEKAMLEMVRNGDLNYKSALNTSMLISSGVPVQGKDPLRQAKISITVFTTIVCRAAIEGGLSPEEAYSLGDSYIQSAEQAAEYTDLSSISAIMYDDFVRRVHNRRSMPGLSAQVRKCCDYIDLHPEEKIRARDLAGQAGYTEYYITHKFRQETGSSISDYIKAAKVRRAKLLLADTELGIQEISMRLGFSTRSYFSQVFRQLTGSSPAEYREMARRP